MSVKTIRQHILSLSELMKDKVKADLPSKFVVVFDGWSEGTEHYIAVSAAYARMDKTTGKEVPVQVMLSMRPLLADGINEMTACRSLAAYHNHIELVQQRFWQCALHCGRQL